MLDQLTDKLLLFLIGFFFFLFLFYCIFELMFMYRRNMAISNLNRIADGIKSKMDQGKIGVGVDLLGVSEVRAAGTKRSAIKVEPIDGFAMPGTESANVYGVPYGFKVSTTVFHLSIFNGVRYTEIDEVRTGVNRGRFQDGYSYGVR